MSVYEFITLYTAIIHVNYKSSDILCRCMLRTHVELFSVTTIADILDVLLFLHFPFKQ